MASTRKCCWQDLCLPGVGVGGELSAAVLCLSWQASTLLASTPAVQLG